MKKLIIGNWKMYPTLSDSLVLSASLKKALEHTSGCDVVLAPPSIWLPTILEHWKHRLSHVAFAVQNIYPEDQGAYTGEISAYFVKDFAKYAIVGHSERRTFLGESNELVNRKVHSAMRWKLQPIICVGEYKKVLSSDGTISEEYHWSKLVEQLKESIAGVKKDRLDEVVIAYEPVWAIGTSSPASAEYAGEVISRLRSVIADKYGSAVAKTVRFVYGGSVDSSNAAEFLRHDEINGLLVGSASVKAKKFLEICHSASGTR